MRCARLRTEPCLFSHRAPVELSRQGQVEPLQVPEKHGVPLVQQGPPDSPQMVHVVVPVAVEQTVSDSVHVLFAQHGSPSKPHGWQVSPVLGQISELPSHASPAFTHWLLV
jgi:hypothetical protein